MSETETEFDPRAAEQPAHTGLEARVQAIEAHLGFGPGAEAAAAEGGAATETETTEGTEQAPASEGA